MRYGDKGADVVEVQVALMDRGYSLSRYGADGHLGDETWNALEQYSKAELDVWDPEVPAGIIESLEDPITPINPGPDVPPADGSVTVLDMRSDQTDPAPKSKVVGGKTVKRAPHTITGITLHQTSCVYGVSQQQINAAGGDRELALHRRALGVACHAMAFMDGTVVLSNPLENYVYHGNGLNAQTCGIELEGMLPGLTSDPKGTTWGGDPTPMTEKMIAAMREAVRQVVELGRAQGMPINRLYAHRQSSASRRSDPGQQVWEEVALWAQQALGLELCQSVTVGDGRPVPVEWDPNGVGHY